MAVEEAERGIEQLRDWYHDLFMNQPHGREVLASMLQYLGYFEMEPERIDKELLAFANRLMYMCRAFGTDGRSQIEHIGRM